MAKRLSIEEKLAQLAEVATRELTDSDIKELTRALAAANNLVVAKAAKVIVKCQFGALIPKLVGAFERFITKSAKSDQRCFAKVALIEALDTLDYQEYDVFLKGMHHIQMEPIYGGQEDTAADLRAKSAIALAKREYPDVYFELVPLLTDLELQPRIAAIKALTYLNEEHSELLLRLKVLTGDNEPHVLSECFAGLMSIAPQRSMPFVATYLTNRDLLIAEGAALALGESRDPHAFMVLRDLWEDALDQELKQLLLLPMALSRCDAAFEFLLDVIACEYRDYAAAAVKALRVYADSEEQRQTIHDAVATRNDPLVNEAYERDFAWDKKVALEPI